MFGANWYGDSVCIDPLCSLVSLLFVPCDPINGVAKVACVLNAIKDTIDELMEWYNCPDPISKGPYFNDNGKLTEVKRMKQVGFNWLFEAKHEGQEVVVKFARLNYGEEIHKYLGEQQLAPRLILCSQVPGGWCAVITYGKDLWINVEFPCICGSEDGFENGSGGNAGKKLRTWRSTSPKYPCCWQQSPFIGFRLGWK